MAERYALMGVEKARFPIGLMARVLCVSRSGHYDWLSVAAGTRGPPRARPCAPAGRRRAAGSGRERCARGWPAGACP